MVAKARLSTEIKSFDSPSPTLVSVKQSHKAFPVAVVVLVFQHHSLTTMADITPNIHETIQDPSTDKTSSHPQEIEDTGEDLQSDAEQDASPPSSISELQSAFPSLLLLTRSTQPPNTIPYTTYRGCPDIPPKPRPPKWTGPFALFDFPRELRDLIYHHAVSRPKGLHHTAHVNNDQYFWYNKDSSLDIANFLCTSRQVCNEAYHIFCRNNTIILGDGNTTRERYNKPLTSLLRLFPCVPARNLTRIRLSYYDEVTRLWGKWGCAPGHGAAGDGMEGYAQQQYSSDTFVDILRDAHTLASFFDKLRVFEACWFMRDVGVTEKDVAGGVKWMQGCLEKGYVEPWEGVRFRLEIDKVQEVCLNEAYGVLVRESKHGGNIEDSGRVWLEELGEGKEKKRGHRKMKSSV
jgi:hypothetical protein